MRSIISLYVALAFVTGNLLACSVVDSGRVHASQIETVPNQKHHLCFKYPSHGGAGIHIDATKAWKNGANLVVEGIVTARAKYRDQHFTEPGSQVCINGFSTLVLKDGSWRVMVPLRSISPDGILTPKTSIKLTYFTIHTTSGAWWEEKELLLGEIQSRDEDRKQNFRKVNQE
jgi:hypothetical protein